MPLPLCEAVMVQLPAAVICTAAPETMQLPVAAKLMASPDEAVALTVRSASPKVLFVSAANAIV